jgi:hypothetical protein
VRSRAPAGDDSRCRGNTGPRNPDAQSGKPETSGVVKRASATQLTRIKNWAQVTGVYIDALTAEHGLVSQ